MKLITAIVNKEDSHLVSKGLTQNGFYVTKHATTGGFLQMGNVTFLIGTEDEKVDTAIGIIAQYSKKRTQKVVPMAGAFMDDPMAVSAPVEVSVGGATVFVTDVERFERL